MDYLIFMAAVFVTIVNLGLAAFVVWFVSDILPDIIKNWRRL
jgi:hypothetical protein